MRFAAALVAIMGLLPVGIFGCTKNATDATRFEGPASESDGEAAGKKAVEAKRSGGMEVPEASAEQGGVAATREVVFTGRVRAVRTSSIAPVVPGIVKRVWVSPGARVQKGDRLVSLVAADLRLSVVQARAQVRAAQARAHQVELEVQRARELLEAGAVPPAQLENVEAGHKTAQAEIDLARASLAMGERSLREAVIRAPFEGLITRVDLEPGEHTSASGAFVAEIADTSKLHVRGFLAEAKTTCARVGDRARITLLAEGRSLNGVVEFVGPTVDLETRTVEVRVGLQGDSSDSPVRLGALSEVRLSCAEKPPEGEA